MLHRSPTTAELAARLGVGGDDVLEAQRSASAYRPWSLEQPVPGTADLRLIDVLSDADPGLEAVDRREMLRWPRCRHGSGASSACDSSAS